MRYRKETFGRKRVRIFFEDTLAAQAAPKDYMHLVTTGVHGPALSTAAATRRTRLSPRYGPKPTQAFCEQELRRIVAHMID